MDIELADSSYSKDKPLSNMRVAITAIDLEQAEHRGIAYLSKGLISSLSDLGAEVYLLTGFYGRRLNPIMKLSMSAQSIQEVDCADILDQLSGPPGPFKKVKRKNDAVNITGDPDSKVTRNAVTLDYELDQDVPPPLIREDLTTKFFNKLIRFKNESKVNMDLFFSVCKFYLHRGRFSGRVINLSNFETSPYFGQERVEYLSKIKGFISIKDIFNFATLRARRYLFNSPKVDLRKLKIDMLITSCPLSIDIIKNDKNRVNCLQLIMDFIPLSYSRHPDHPFGFYNRLKDSLKAKTCFISKASRDKISSLLENSFPNDDKNIIYPLPSLSINKLQLASRVKNLRGIGKKYILFNSSVVPRKNLHFLVNIFQSSELATQGFELCVAGKIHDDEYGKDIRRMCKIDSNIQLLDYVDETEKAWLFLNAYAFVSPSCVEGFGIPVLDAASLGVRVLASDIPSHREIADIVQANNNFRLLDLSNVDEWIDEFNLLNNLDICIEDEIKSRISNFNSCFQSLKKSFDESILDLVT